jgi:hypothetical protein
MWEAELLLMAEQQNNKFLRYESLSLLCTLGVLFDPLSKR